MRIRSLLSISVLALLITAAEASHAAGALPAEATPVQRVQAQSRFQRGKELLAKKQYAAALAEFQASHEIVASPNTRLQIARCLRASGRTVAAYAELGRTAVEAKELVAQDNRYQRAYDAALAERTEIEPQLGFVTMTIQNAEDGTRMTVGGEEIGRAAWDEPVPVLSGATEVVVESPGHPPVKRTVSLTAGQRSVLTIDAHEGDPPAPVPAAPPPEAARPAPGLPRTWAYVAGGVGAAGLITFAVFGTMAKSTYDDLNGACPNGACPPDKAGAISSGKSQETIANVGLAVGVVGLGAAAGLYFLSMPKSTPGSRTGLVVAPGWIGARGSW
jgi:hypothetical protein